MARTPVNDRWQIDWNDDGFMHADSDVSLDVEEYILDLGADSFVDDEEVLAKTADGVLILDNQDNKYTVESLDSIGTSILLRRHRCRLVGSTGTLWQGWALPPQVELRGAPIASVDLRGFRTDDISRDYPVFIQDGRTNRDLLNDMSDFVGADRPEIATIINQNTGIVRHTESFGRFALYLQRYINGYIWEDEEGRLGAVSHDILRDADSEIDLLPSEYRILDTNAISRSAIDLIRNRVTTRQLDVFQTPNQVVAHLGLHIDARDTITTTTSLASLFTVEVTNWPTLPELQALAPRGVVLSALETTGNSLTVTAQNRNNTPVVATIDITATAHTISQIRNVTFRDAESIRLYGEREADVPPWYDNAALGWGLNKVRNLKDPLQTVELTIPRSQDTIIKTSDIERLRIGHPINVIITNIDGITIQTKMLIVGVTLVGRSEEPSLKVLRLLSVPRSSETTIVFTWGVTEWGVHEWGASDVETNDLEWAGSPLSWNGENLTWDAS